MKIERFEIPGLAQYSYVISSEGQAVVVDAIRDFDRYISYAAQQGLKITHVVETHIHADFAAGSKALAEAAGAELALSAHDEGEHYRYAMPHRRLSDGDVVKAGKVRLEARHTPGHTPEHLSFLAFDEERSGTEPVALFSGDFLFVGSLGRPDLLGEEAKLGLAHELYRSLHERIAKLPDGVEVYPGHGAGSLCGSGMSERAESTLGYERRTNPLFGLKEEAFVREILGSVPPMPRYYPRMKALNSEGAETALPLPGAKALGTAELAAMAREEDVEVLDLRRPEAFGGAHIPGSVNIGAGQNLSLWAGWMLDPAKRIVLVGDNGNGNGDNEQARRSLVRVGLDRIAGFLKGGMPAWIDGGMEFSRTKQMTVREVEAVAATKTKSATTPQVLDVRSDAEWKQGHIQGARHVMLGDLPKRMGELDKSAPLVAVCGSGYRSSVAASLLEREGFAASSMDGGMGAWNQQKLELERD